MRNLNEIKPRLKSILEHHQGRDSAITRRELRHILEYHDDRHLRLMIRELIAEGLPVVSRTDKPAGYFLPITRQELDGGRETLRSYIIEECKRLRDLKKFGTRYLEGAEQIRLF
tara:strand:+ start:297 stop:638 length:342 start_codon:yes stop_codon:yes gene_type:complete